MADFVMPRGEIQAPGDGNHAPPDVFEKMRAVEARLNRQAIAHLEPAWLIDRLRAVLATIQDASVTYGIIGEGDPPSVTPMMVERDAIVEALYVE